MTKQNQFQKKEPLIIITIGIMLSIIVTGILLISFSYYLSKKLSQLVSLPKIEKTSQKVPQVILPNVLYNLSGTIRELNQDSLTLEATISQSDENGELSSKTEIRKILIASTTKFSRLDFVIQEGTNRKISQETQMTLNDIKVGDYIEVISNQDISQVPEFEATQIRVLPKNI